MDNDKKALLEKISGTQLALLECTLFLDTHPGDAEAVAKRNEYMDMMKELVKQYEAAYGPLTLTADFGDSGFDWVKNPWPWEREAN